VPVQVPYVETVIKTVATSAPATSTTTTAQALASAAGLGDLVKKILFRAAGEEGLAENIAAKAVKAASCRGTCYHEQHNIQNRIPDCPVCGYQRRDLCNLAERFVSDSSDSSLCQILHPLLHAPL
jgi:hypothetical protein